MGMTRSLACLLALLSAASLVHCSGGDDTGVAACAPDVCPKDSGSSSGENGSGLDGGMASDGSRIDAGNEGGDGGDGGRGPVLVGAAVEAFGGYTAKASFELFESQTTTMAKPRLSIRRAFSPLQGWSSSAPLPSDPGWQPPRVASDWTGAPANVDALDVSSGTSLRATHLSLHVYAPYLDPANLSAAAVAYRKRLSNPGYAGRGEAPGYLDTIVRDIPAHPILFTMCHEMDQRSRDNHHSYDYGMGHPQGLAAGQKAFREGFARFHAMVHGYQRPNWATAVVWMSLSWHDKPFGGYDPDPSTGKPVNPLGWYPGPGNVDFVMVDAYARGAERSPQQWASIGFELGDPKPAASGKPAERAPSSLLSPGATVPNVDLGAPFGRAGFVGWARGAGLPWGVAELGASPHVMTGATVSTPGSVVNGSYRTTASDSGGPAPAWIQTGTRAEWLADAADYLVGSGAKIVEYYSASEGKTSYWRWPGATAGSYVADATLGADVGTTQTTLQVSSLVGWPSVLPFYVLLDPQASHDGTDDTAPNPAQPGTRKVVGEYVIVTAVNAASNTLTVRRARSPLAFATGTVVRPLAGGGTELSTYAPTAAEDHAAFRAVVDRYAPPDAATWTW